MKRYMGLIALAVVTAFLFSSCLTCEYKEYKFELTGKNSGKLTIKYVNIMSKKDDEELTKKEEIEKDFNELVDNYINGNEIEKKYPNAKIVVKELYEENYKLNGRVVIEFSDISQVQLYRYDKKSPIMYYLQSLSSETYASSNGTQGPDYLPIVFWDKALKTLDLKTTVAEQSEETSSLLQNWKDWKSNH